MSAKHRSSSGGGLGFLRPIFSVIVLTAFILAITFTVRGISQLQTSTLLLKAKPLLANININIDDSKIGQVAGSMVSKITNTNLGGGGSSQRVDIPITQEAASTNTRAVATTSKKDATVVTEISFLADSHSNYVNLEKALTVTKDKGISTVFFLGDYTALGLTEDLTKAQQVMDASKIKYYSLPGDHDLWKSVGPQNFTSVFGDPNKVVKVGGLKFVLLDNSANYTVISEPKMAWFKKELADADFVVLSQPLYYPKLDRYMGRVNGEDVPDVLAQRNELLQIIRDSKVKAVIAADLHNSDTLDDPEKPALKHILIGALTDERNLQSPRFSIFKYYSDSSYDLQDVVLE